MIDTYLCPIFRKHDFLNLGIANAIYWLLPWSPSVYLTLLSLPDAMDSLDERVKTFFKKCSTPATKQENADEHFSKIKTVSLLANKSVSYTEGFKWFKEPPFRIHFVDFLFLHLSPS